MRQNRQLLPMLLAASMIAGPLGALIFADPPRKKDAGTQPGRTEEVRAAVNRKSETANPSLTRTERKTSNIPAEKRVAPLSSAREEIAIQFAREHHPELAELLEGLRKSDHLNFQAGLLDLARDAERLAKLAERDDERYVAAIVSWELDSRIRLEIARLSMAPGEDFETRLRPLMEARQAARIQLLELDRERSIERLAKTDEQLKSLKSNPNELITSEIERFRKLAASRTRTKAPRPQAPNATTATDQRKVPETKTSRTKN